MDVTVPSEVVCRRPRLQLLDLRLARMHVTARVIRKLEESISCLYLVQISRVDYRWVLAPIPE